MKFSGRKRLFGLVLAGGRSVRMGCDKASLVHPDGRPMALRAKFFLEACGCDEVLISLRDGQVLPDGLGDVRHENVLRDPVGERGGPLTAIFAAMEAHLDVDWMVIACDMPRLEAETIGQLLRAREQGENVLAYRAGAGSEEAEPLCAFYGGEMREILREWMKRGGASLRSILKAEGCRLLDPPWPGALANANTPEEWRESTVTDGAPEWQAELLEIWISPGNNYRGRHGKGSMAHPALCVPEVEVVAGMGLTGDRYFGYEADFKGQVSFLQVETLEAIRERFSLPDLCASSLRRNLLVSGVKLREWKGRTFRFQGITFQGVEECKPCYWMDQAVAPGAEEFLRGDFQGGLRARVMTNGLLRV